VPPLREVRADRLLTIRELARRAAVAPSTIYLIETGRTTPRLRMVQRLATALEVEPQAVDEFRQAIEAAKEPRRRRPSQTGTP
jgi:transcriptional regulator with XRE-family HTH domain